MKSIHIFKTAFFSKEPPFSKENYGTLINIIKLSFNFRFILVETGDDFTRSFYRNMDIVDFSPIDISSL